MYSFYRIRRRHNSIRYPGRDYRLPGKYFVTICTENRTEWFGEIINSEMQLSEIGSIAFNLWCEIPHHFPYITLDEFIIMPNHIHGIIIINKSNDKSAAGSLHATALPPDGKIRAKNLTMSNKSPKSGSLSVVIRSYKSAVSKIARTINKDFSWQRGYHDIIICTSGQLSRIRKYIKNNPRN